VLHEFITFNRDEIIRRCRAKVAIRSVPPPTEAEINHGVPLFLDQLVSALRSGVTNPEISRSAVLHGHDLLLQGFTVSQVVHDYGDICQSITDLAMEVDAPISTQDFRTLNQCLDDAIAGAVTEFGRGRNQSTLDGEAARGTERLGFLAHELRNLMHTALLALEVLKTGNVGVTGSTGQVLHRSLIGARDLIGRSLAEVRLTQGVENRERIEMSGFIDGLAPAATLEANARGITFESRASPSRPTGRFSPPSSSTCCRTPSSSHTRTRRSRSESAPVPNVCSSRSRMNAAAFLAER
jgi:signal transduction histidine kinase